MVLGKFGKMTLLPYFKTKDNEKLQEGHFDKIFWWHSIWDLRVKILLLHVLTN